MKNSNRGKLIFIYAVAVILGFITLIPVFSKSITLDEAYTVRLVECNISEIVSGSASDVHPPLYYLILKALSFILGDSLAALRFATGIATLLNLLVLGATFIRKQFGCRVSLFYMLWFGLSYFTLEKTTLVRMYSWGCFFATAAVLFLFLYIKSKKRTEYISAILFTLAAMYTHYYGVMTVFAAWFICLIYTVIKERKNILNIVFAGVLIVVGYLPWMKSFLSQSGRVADDYWIKVFDWKEWFLSPAQLMEGNFQGVGIILFVFGLVMLIYSIIKKNKVALVFWAVFYGTMLMGALLSVYVTPIWQVRYLYNAWGVYALGVACVLGKKKGYLGTASQIITVCFLLFAGYLSVNSLLQNEVIRNDAKEFILCVENNIQPGDCIIVDDAYEHYIIYEYYAPDTDVIMTERLNLNAEAQELTELIGKYEDNNVWFMINYVMPQVGVGGISEHLGEHYCLENVGTYTIQYKIIDIYCVKEAADEE